MIDLDQRIEGFAFTDIALSRRILTTTSLRARYAVAVTLVRDWVPIHVGVSIARGGLVATAVVVGTVVAAETFTTVLGRPRTGRLADRHGRAAFVALGGTTYGPVALAVPFAPAVSGALPPGRGLSLPFGVKLAPAMLVVLGPNALLGVADSSREPASMATFADEGVEGDRLQLRCPQRRPAPREYHRADTRWRPHRGRRDGVGVLPRRDDRANRCPAFLGVLSYPHGRGTLRVR